MKKISGILVLLMLTSTAFFGQEIKNEKMGKEFIITTTVGTMKIKLYDETPLHRDNFIKNAEKKYYDGMLFHRVIKSFMIQTGDPNSINAPSGKALGFGGPGYTIPAEFNTKLIHKKGALAAARTGDSMNPKKESSGSQFYIVQGQVYNEEILSGIEAKKGMNYTEEQKNIYTTIGGTPFLDNEYTVFGEIIEGLEIIDTIAAVKTGANDRPAEDVKILSITAAE